MNFIILFIIIIIIIIYQNNSENYDDIKKIDYKSYNDFDVPNRLNYRFYPWYNPITPLPFNNPTRFYGYYYYPAIQEYYYPRVVFY
jgi:hypothetical protein